MFEISLYDIEHVYNTLKNKAFNCYSHNKIDQLINFIDASASIAAHFNWIFTDAEVEDLLRKVAYKYVYMKGDFVPNSKKIVFYDQIGSTTCLGLQYLRGLIGSDFEILYIFESSTRKCSPVILEELSKCAKATSFIINSSKSNKIGTIIELYNTILSFQPQKSIFHSPAEGAFGVILWNALPQIKRYRIVPGDHHFYLGISCTDFFFEFRKYGYTVAIEKRYISKDKILFQPYYPVIDNDLFYGFPIKTQNKVIIFSAGAMYKSYGENDLYFHIIKKLLFDYPQVIFLFAGGGFDVPFKNFVKTNNFQNRLILLGFRQDLNMCIANSDIFLATFPFTGGLTTQYAAYYSKPILSYTTADLSMNIIDDLIGSPLFKKQPITYTDLNAFFSYAKELILNKQFRMEEGIRVNKILTTKQEFNYNLMSNLGDCVVDCVKEKLYIDYNKHLNLYLNIERNYIPILETFLVLKFRFNFINLFPQLIIPILFNSMFYKRLIKRLRCK